MSTNRMRGIARATLVFCAAFCLAACSTKSHAAPIAEGESRVPGGNSPLRLALVTDAASIGDRSFDDSAYAGLMKAKVRLGADVQVLQSQSAADYQSDLTVLADQDFDEIFAIGASMQRDVAVVARNYPKRRFAIVDARVDLVNVTSLLFREQEGSFLAGALAAMVSKTKHVAFLGGVDIPPLRAYEAGFAAGAREIDPKIVVSTKYVGSFADAAAGNRRAGALFDRGADIVFVVAGKSERGAIEQVRGRTNDYLIGVGADRDTLAPGKILTNVVERVDVAIFKTALQAQAQKLPSGPVEFGLKDDAIGLTDFHQTRAIVGAAHLARLATLRTAILAGKIVPPSTREELAAFKRVAF